MKTITLSTLGLLFTCCIISCSNKDHRYIDVETGNYIDVVKDSTNGKMINADTRDPVIIYADTQNNDTIYGKTGKVINGQVIKSEGGKYKYISSEDRPDKVKTGDDGEYKIKDGDKKIKIDGETGEKKIKSY